MEINYFSFVKLRNEEHFQFHTDVRNLIIQATPATLGIEIQYSAYLVHYANENEALNLIRKNTVYEQLVAADLVRDTTFRGLTYLIKSSCFHFNPAIRQAALRVNIVFDQYKDITRKSFNQETASINNLISRLNQDYAADVTTLGITGWLNELQSKNTAFDNLMKSRNSQEAAKTKLRMGQVRLELDAAYQLITDRINALIIVNGAAAYMTFVDKLNQWIVTYSNSVAIRSGKKSKDNPPPASEN